MLLITQGITRSIVSERLHLPLLFGLPVRRYFPDQKSDSLPLKEAVVEYWMVVSDI